MLFCFDYCLSRFLTSVCLIGFILTCVLGWKAHRAATRLMILVDNVSTLHLTGSFFFLSFFINPCRLAVFNYYVFVYREIQMHGPSTCNWVVGTHCRISIVVNRYIGPVIYHFRIAGSWFSDGLSFEKSRQCLSMRIRDRPVSEDDICRVVPPPEEHVQ